LPTGFYVYTGTKNPIKYNIVKFCPSVIRQTMATSYSEYDPENFILTFKSEILKLTLKLYSNENLSRSMAHGILNQTFSTYQMLFGFIRITLEKQNVKFTEEMNKLFHFIENFKFLSEFKLFNELEKLGLLVKPYDYFIDAKSKIVNDSIKVEKFIMKIVPLQTLFSQMFSIKNFLDELINFMDSLNGSKSDFISNILQSPLWQKKLSMLEKCDSTLYVPITIYFDDFDPLNALAGHAGAYKIGGVYLQIACLPPHIQSKLDFILMAALFFSEDRKTYGNERIFVQVIKELNALQEVGIPINFRQYTKVKLIPILVVGDNLGLNGILGFTEGFRHYYFCRFCLSPKTETQFLTIANNNDLRNRANYEEALVNKSPETTGVMEDSPFNKLLNFHATENPSVDIMHDVLEGIMHFDIGQILEIFIYKQKLFTLEELNFRLQGLHYGPNKQLSMLLSDTMIKKHRLKFSASEMLLFSINLPFAIGDLVPEDSLEWQLYLLLRKIMTIVLFKSVHKKLHVQLKNVIQEHHEVYLALFEKLAQAKLHLIVHYDEIMKIIGPLIAAWSMRYENKHQTFDQIANLTRCRKNLVHTLAIKHQLKMADLFLNKDCKLEKFEPGGAVVEIEAFELFELYNVNIRSKYVSIMNSAFYNGNELKKDFVIQYDHEIDDLPIFGLIKCIFVHDDSYFVCIENLTNAGFNSHYYSYRVFATSCFQVLNLNQITNFKNSHISSNCLGEQMVIWD
jgi:hypothetical protein